MFSMFKIVGIIFAFLASSLIGFMKSNEIKKRKQILEDFRELINLISTRIGYFKEPLPVIFKTLLPETKDEAHSLLEKCLMAYEMGEKDIGNIWESSVKNVYSSTSIDEDDIKIISKCGQFLGQSDYESQKKHFKLIDYQMERHIDDAEQQVRTKGKMYSKIGMSLGVLIAIVLL